EDAQKAYDEGAVYCGLIFVEKSPSYVDISVAKQIVKKVRLNYVGFFADAKIEDVLDTCYALKISAVQLHGDENQEYIYN
ncbi:bifunctional indole-3-glycerol phosphate synthase/phosphoribosylanthranilate isomerase, partial [Francisella tularensis subsp. holarctica]|nr:bifunctional indole-3-glycerol phosphate synthase/phosphoribosylanthranilate isomerase [Francisella tularensis subsp. holarctica]